jgi:hypothetical protein
VVWIEEGSAEIQSGDLRHTLRPGSVLVTPRGTGTRFGWDERAVTLHGFVAFSAPSATALCVVLPSSDVVPAMLRHLVHLDLSRPDDWRRDAEHVLAVALHAPRAAAAPALTDVVRASLEQVRSRWPWQGPWPAVPLDVLADAASVTPEQLCRAWTRNVGTSRSRVCA